MHDGLGAKTGWLSQQCGVEGQSASRRTTRPLAFHGTKADLLGLDADAPRPSGYLCFEKTDRDELLQGLQSIGVCLLHARARWTTAIMRSATSGTLLMSAFCNWRYSARRTSRACRSLVRRYG